MKLKIDLVPSTVWYSNLRNKISNEEWDKIRKKSYSDSNHVCAICGSKGKLNCHEIWEYNDQTHVQKLKGFTALCDNCHMIKHIGFAGIQSNKRLLDMDNLIDHFMNVNNVNKEIFDKHREESFRIWRERSKHNWKTDLSKWAVIVKK